MKHYHHIIEIRSTYNENTRKVREVSDNPDPDYWEDFYTGKDSSYDVATVVNIYTTEDK